MPAVAAPPSSRRRQLELAARWLLVAGFLWLAGRFWHPYYGFTRLLQFDEAAAVTMLPELRRAPVFLYPGQNGYDGLYYAQLAADPLARHDALPAAIDNAAYRARRILPSWLAWAVAGGNPAGALQAYAWLNLGAWLALAAVLGRILPPGDGRRTLAWAGVLLSAGALHSVRLSLSDLPAVVLAVLAWRAIETGRTKTGGAWLGLAALSRETSLLGAVALWQQRRHGWRQVAGAAALAILPVALWLVYLCWRLGAADPGLGNFQWPLTGLGQKWLEDAYALGTETDTWLALTTLLATLGVTVQAAYVVRHRQWREVWWGVAAVYVLLAATLGQPVWEGHPGAATRVLLPLTVAFNVLAARNGAAWRWLVAGNLGVLAGVLTWLHVPSQPDEFTAGRSADHGGYVVRLAGGWHGREAAGSRVWAWSERSGRLEIRLRAAAERPAPLAATLGLRALTPRVVTISQDGRELWRGEAGGELRRIEVRGINAAAGRATLDFSTDEPPGRSPGDGRDLGFAVYDLRFE